MAGEDGERVEEHVALWGAEWTVNPRGAGVGWARQLETGLCSNGPGEPAGEYGVSAGWLQALRGGAVSVRAGDPRVGAWRVTHVCAVCAGVRPSARLRACAGMGLGARRRAGGGMRGVHAECASVRVSVHVCRTCRPGLDPGPGVEAWQPWPTNSGLSVPSR